MRFKFLKKKEIKKLPKKPGVYCFLDKGRKILNAKHSRFLPKARFLISSKARNQGSTKGRFLYIGKATNIQNRIKNHFQQPGFKEKIFLDKAKKMGFIKTDSEIEALILEAHLIKKYKPQYNVIWKDDKNYFYIARTEEEFPRVFWTHQPFLESRIRNQESRIKKKKLHNSSFIIHNSKFQFVGPFVDGKALKQTLKVLRKIFPYRSCKILPKKPCLWYQLSRCPAPCLIKASAENSSPLRISLLKKMKKECQQNAKSLLKILRGERNQVLGNLKKEMKEVSKSQEFEKAAKIRGQIFALEKILAHSKIFGAVDVKHQQRKNWEVLQKILQRILKTKQEISRIEAYDVSNISGKLATGAMVTFINGKPDKSFYRKFKIKYANSARSAKASRNANAHMRIKKPNDIAMIKEVLARRLRHPEWGWPDLILIDGGRGQLNTVLEIIKSRRILAIAIAKKKNELYLKGRKPILLKNLPREIFNLVLQLRDEAHRFALRYHKELRKKKMLTRN